MKRRTFVKNSTLTAFSIATIGSIHWNGKSFVGDNTTTTDILGPFYRPGASDEEQPYSRWIKR